MVRKQKNVRTAVFGQNLRIELKKYPLSKAGNKINIVDSGEGYFMPEIGPNTFLDWPIRKKYLFFGEWIYERTYIVLKRGSRCIDFSLDDPKAYGPDIEQTKKANANLLATKIGSESEKGIPWYSLIMLGMLLIILLRVLGVG